MSSGPNLECGHGQCDVRRDCMTCLQFTVQTLNDRHYKQGIELSNCEANLADAREALQWIAAQEDLTFAECSLAEKIIWRAKNWSTEGKCAVIITKEGDRCTREEGHEGAHELDLTRPAAKEQPAGSGAKLPNVMRVGRSAAQEMHLAGSMYCSACNMLVEVGSDDCPHANGMAGSPRKVGEDGLVTRETLEHWLRVVKSTLDPDGWDCGAPELRRMREQLEFALTRPSSVPVGEQQSEVNDAPKS